MSTTPEFTGDNRPEQTTPAQGSPSMETSQNEELHQQDTAEKSTQHQSQIEQTAAERAAGKARESATAAADALRRGEFMHDATVDSDANGDDKLIAMLSYVTQLLIPIVMPAIVLLSESSKKRPFQRYHAVQSMALTIVFIAIAAAVSIGTAILQAIPVVGVLVGFIVVCLSPIAYFMAAIALIYYGYQSYQGKRFSVPGLTSILRDQGWLS